MVGTVAFAFPLIFRLIDLLARLVPRVQRLCSGRPQKGPAAADDDSSGPSCVTYVLLVPLASLGIMAIFSVPFLPLAWAHSQHFTGFEDSAEFWSHGFEMATDFTTPKDDLSETQRRVFKLQLYLLILFVGIRGIGGGL